MTSGVERQSLCGASGDATCAGSKVCPMVESQDGRWGNGRSPAGRSNVPSSADESCETFPLTIVVEPRNTCVTDLARPRIQEAPVNAGASSRSALAAPARIRLGRGDTIRRRGEASTHRARDVRARHLGAPAGGPLRRIRLLDRCPQQPEGLRRWSADSYDLVKV